MNRLMNSGLMYPSSSKASALIGGKDGASLAGASAIGGEGGDVTFPVISVHCGGGVIPALPRIRPAAMVRGELSSTGVSFETEGVGGATAGEVLFRVAHTFCFREGPFFILQRTKLSKSGNSAEQGRDVSADLLLAGDVEPSESVVIF